MLVNCRFQVVIATVVKFHWQTIFVEDKMLGDPGAASAVVELVAEVEAAIGIARHRFISGLITSQHQRVARDVAGCGSGLSGAERREQKQYKQLFHVSPQTMSAGNKLYQRRRLLLVEEFVAFAWIGQRANIVLPKD